MQNIKINIAQKIADKILADNSAVEISGADILAMFEYPPDPALGDLALPCFKLSRTLRRSPMQIADAIAEGLSGEEIEKVESVKGYINIFISNEFLITCICTLLSS